ncbi:beta-mannosidase [Rhodococcus sp. BP-349]|nr:beta-mannosidase [Rhodococcus sp. BP-363]MBY6541871.1 beta-mannosidase [Rhodococcus sp. BP-369]MBY6561101.1 beta-mannosidase [Rhodococcus sp. BP-370]MBY6575393.1 beta-mannosidase [Rhodococcus sp. BP-364]MBY6584694.1 beta-mannosidase [Rhodococcus sp. BP-358]MBY6589031.1 beta-mannosidase [Rhodococcus sp. BP-362]MBY6594436.1 beta-mannosidase [Rhodococcus sp. BP-359]MBY6597707.1 beta-mannosidase [Rhodococcus sp. BP-353]MBY6603113.1 beta-mannosidase [Rhodococcus sp. BP-351]MBY6607449.1 beta-
MADAHWTLRSTDAGAAESPGDLVDTDSAVPAHVPGTVAGALTAARLPLQDLDGRDWWYDTEVSVPEGVESVRLHLEGIATLSEVWIDGRLATTSTSMFVPVTVEARVAGTMSLALCCRSLDAALRTRRPRGRWRSSMISSQGLRWIRTSMLGRAPVFTGAPAPVGPWRAVRCVGVDEPIVAVRGLVRDGRCILQVDGVVSSVRITLGDSTFDLEAGADSTTTQEIDVGDRALWWPHTHGDPALHDVTVTVGERVVRSRVGFRSSALRGTTLLVNEVPVFCRGGCWVPLDPITLQNDPERLRDTLTSYVEAGLNMVRLTGTMVYESTEFHTLCSELGIMVWQDVMLATIDPPDDPAVESAVVDEVRAMLAAAGGPSLVVVSGGSETYQQPTMLGLAADESRIPLLDSIIPDVLRDFSGVSYVPSTPSGGDLATHVGSGFAHYFGIGGYLRPLSDVRYARVAFATECLAFSVPPERRVVDSVFGSAHPAGHDPRWKATVPRDRGASWDFEDVRDHYVRTLFDVEPSAVRRDDPERYLDLGRAAVCEAVTHSVGFWRQADSGCGGALVLTLRDLEPGAGWGLTDSTGAAKAPWYALARASAPTTVLVTDEGMDGLRLDVMNDGADPVAGTLTVRAHQRTGAVAAEGVQRLALDAHSSWTGTADGVVGRFTDMTHAHRFGSRTVDAVSVVLATADGTVLAEAVHLVENGLLPLQNSVGLTATAAPEGDGRWTLTVGCTDAAQFVCVDVDGYRASDSWFHLAPGTSRALTLLPRSGSTTPRGHVRAVNSTARATVTVLER